MNEKYCISKLFFFFKLNVGAQKILSKGLVYENYSYRAVYNMLLQIVTS